jgi:glycerol kinase
MIADLLLILDAGTTSARALAFDRSGQIIAQASRPLASRYPRPGEVEQDAAQIWQASHACLAAVLAEVGAARIAAMGLTNQRETLILWDALTSAPLAPAIVWQDRRTAPACAALRAAGHEPMVQARTGLLLDPYFTATKLRWALDHHEAVARAQREGRLRAGTVDSWLIWNLTHGERHITDATNASRTLLMNLATRRWDPELLALFNVPPSILPEITDCAGPLGQAKIGTATLPLTGCAGDQQAAGIGQACLAPGDVKATYGTGAFVLAHAGAAIPRSAQRLLATLAWQIGGKPAYALEGSIFVAGAAVHWLRDGLGLIASAAETESLARSVADSGGVQFVPALAGLGAPHWAPDARGLITGLTAGTTKAHLVRATLEAMGQQTADLLDAFKADGLPVTLLHVDGGMVANNWLCQDIADSIAVRVRRPRLIETTALGAALLTGLGCGWFASLEEAAGAMVHPDRDFEPQGDPAPRRAAWAHALRQTLAP